MVVFLLLVFYFGSIGAGYVFGYKNGLDEGFQKGYEDARVDQLRRRLYR